MNDDLEDFKYEGIDIDVLQAWRSFYLINVAVPSKYWF